MIIIVTGGRNNHLTSQHQHYLKHLFTSGLAKELVCGMAQGVDTDAYNVVKPLAPVKECYADWNNLDVPNCKVGYSNGRYYNALAGYNRNQYMAEYGIQRASELNTECVLIAFPGGSGTENMISIAKKLKLKILRKV